VSPKVSKGLELFWKGIVSPFVYNPIWGGFKKIIRSFILWSQMN
jgi:hypothetical protein